MEAVPAQEIGVRKIVRIRRGTRARFAALSSDPSATSRSTTPRKLDPSLPATWARVAREGGPGEPDLAGTDER